MKAKISLIVTVFLSFSLFLCSKEDTKESKKEIVLESPANHSLLKNPVIFKWNHVSDAENYEIALSSASDFSKILLNQRTENPEFESLERFSPGTYYWKVRAEKENSQWGDWSYVNDFTIIDIPKLIFPAANVSIGSFGLRFQWEEVSYGVEYQIMAAADSSFSSPVIDEYTETASYTPQEEISVGTYYWKVRGKDSLLNWGEWSETERFDVIDLYGTFTDPRDGYTYKTIQIGDQVWMAENLRVTIYRNGDPIPNVADGAAWYDLYETESGAYCAYENADSNAEVYGYLYNWYAVNDSRGLAPEGWHVPTDEEWKELEMYLGMSQWEANSTDYRGTNEGSKLAGKAWLWADGRLIQNASFGSSGFSALPGGYRHCNGNFANVGDHGTFWSATESGSASAWTRYLYCNYATVGRGNGYKCCGFSLRLVRD